MAASDLVNLAPLIDHAKGSALVRQHRWQEGLRYPGRGSGAVMRPSGDDTQLYRRVFARAVGGFAEAEGHHPEFGFGWGQPRALLQTRTIQGRHENDFILAARIDRLAGETSAHV
jgi:hypothetical protein